MSIQVISAVTYVKYVLFLMDFHKQHFQKALISRSALYYSAQKEAFLKGSTGINKQQQRAEEKDRHHGLLTDPSPTS